MMRYSEISRDLSSDSLRYVELGNEYIYKNLHEDSPASDISSYSSPLLNCPTPPPPPTGIAPYQQCNLHQQQHQSACNLDNNSTNQMSDCCNRKGSQRNSKRFSSGNGTANGAATISYTRQRKDSTKSTQSCHFILDGEHLTASASKPIHVKNSKRKNSIGCLNTLSSSPDSPGCYYAVSNPPTLNGKSQSLPGHASIKNLDETILSALRVSADELANQITLLDFPIFAAIQPDELTSCAWTKKDKQLITPNIVAFTKRFNHTSFWTVQEILSAEQPKQRAEILTHFIKVAKKLHELNNLHSLFAIISAMQSASIYRLKKTWACLSKKDKQSYERLSDIFSDQNNWANLREYLESLRLPCIPYLGLFLTDLIYIDLAHPHKGGLETEQRRNKMNNILRVIANYQQSNYTYLPIIETTQKYLTSIRYIEELQNIFEEDQYKKSLKLEPASPSGPSSSSCSSKESFNADAVSPALACLNISPAKTIGSMRLTGGNKFIPGHRKCRSLGTNIFGKITHNHHNHNDHSVNNRTPAINYIDNLYEHNLIGVNQPRHLLDDSVLEHCNTLNNGSIIINDAITNENVADGGGIQCSHYYDKAKNTINIINGPALNTHDYIQGCVRRKTVQKEGRKPAVASWQRYWLQIWANSLVYFPPKSFKGTERTDFKREPCKVCLLDGWYAQIIDNPKHKNSFELYHRTMGTIYKFRTDSAHATYLWISTICKLATQHNTPKPLPPINLMSFE